MTTASSDTVARRRSVRGVRWLALACLGVLAPALEARAQNLIIANARILDRGTVVPRGAIVVRDGRIAAIVPGAPPQVAGARVIDAQGRTVMPGFIDSHRHPVGGAADQWLAERAEAQMQEFLDAGFTTVLSAGDAPPQVLQMKRRIENGQLKGPRLLVAGRIPLARALPPPDTSLAVVPGGDPARFDRARPPLRPTRPAGAIPPAETIAAVDALAKSGVDLIKTTLIVTPGGPEAETLALVVSEGRKHGLQTLTHAVTVDDTLAAVAAGVKALAHTPHIGQLTQEQAIAIARSGVVMTSTLGIFIPFFGPDNRPLFRDGLPFPWDTLSSGGQGPVNARMLTEAGVGYVFGTDTRWSPRDSLQQELRALGLMFSPMEIVTFLTAGDPVGLSAHDGMEVGALADLVIVDGDPLQDIFALLRVATTIKGGVVVSEKR